MANWNKLTERQFSAIKMLLKGGATQAEAAEYMQVSNNTAFWVNKAENYEEYLQIQAERVLKKKQVATIKTKGEPQEKPQETKQQPAAPQVMNPTVVKIEATHYMMQELQKTNELLTAISSKLAFIVDELTK